MPLPRTEYMTAWFVAELPEAGLPESFGIVTAYNPNGEAASNAENEAAMNRLREALVGRQYFPIIGGSRDGAHQEPSFGIVTNEIEFIRELSRQFQQEAFYWVVNGIIFCSNTQSETLYQVDHWENRQIPV